MKAIGDMAGHMQSAVGPVPCERQQHLTEYGRASISSVR